VPGKVQWELKDRCRAGGTAAVATDLDDGEAPRWQEGRGHPVLMIAKQAVQVLNMQVPHHMPVRTRRMLAKQHCKQGMRYLHMLENAHTLATAYTPKVQLCTLL
jgi:hypothetical protein